MEKKINVKRLISVVILIVIALTSIFGISKVTSKPEFHEKAIKSLDDKKITVMELTAATAAASTALALIPSDATTPLANQIAQLSSYLLIVIGAIFLEKVLLTLTGYVAFTYLIPIACLLYLIYLYFPKDILKNLAIKLSLFGIVMVLVIPVSVQVSNLIEKTYSKSINQTIEDAKNTDIVAEENEKQEDDENWWEGFTSKVTEGISSIGDSISGILEKGKTMLGNFIDAIAIMLITSCVIPIAVLIFFIWIIKIIFGVSIPSVNIKQNKKQLDTTTVKASETETEKK